MALMQPENPMATPARRFSIRVLLLVVGLFAGLFAYLSYYRPAKATVVCVFLTAESSAIDALALNLQSQEGSPYSWTWIDRETQDRLCAVDPSAARLLRKEATISMWPRQAATATWLRPVFLEVIDPRQGEYPAKYPTFDSAMFSGFLGVRRAGTSLQFRVEGEATLHRAEGVLEMGAKLQPDKVSGKIFYEGKVPNHALMFVAPLDEHSQHVVLFALED